MSEIETFDELEAGLSRAFHREPLPVAPDRLREALVDVVAVGSPSRQRSASRRSTLGFLGLAAMLAIGGTIAFSAAGQHQDPRPSTPPEIAGGTRITYEPQWTAAVPATDGTRMELVRVVRARLDAAGLSNATVDDPAADRLVVVLPQGADVASVLGTLGATGVVTFVPLGQDQIEAGQPVDLALHPALFDGSAVSAAAMGSDQTGSAVLNLSLRPDASAAFGAYTTAHVGDFFAIAADGVVVSAPRVNAAIPGGQIQIAGPDLERDALRRVADVLTSGPLPVRLVEVSVEPHGSPVAIASANPPPTSEPSRQAPAPELSCPPSVAATGPVMTCEAAIGAVLGLLPPGILPVGPIEFAHACVDVTGRGAQLDCFIDGFGLVTMHLSNGNVLVAQVSTGHPGVQVVAPFGGDDANQLELLPGVRAIECTGGIEAATYTLRIDPAASPAVWLETPAGSRVEIRFASPVVGLARPFPMLLDAPDRAASGRWFLGGDGATIPTGGDPSVGPPRLFVCGATDGALILEAGGI